MLFGVMWTNIIQLGRPQMIVWCMRIAYGITEATNTHTDYAILIALPLQQWLYEHASPNTYIACLVMHLPFFYHNVRNDIPQP